MALPHEEAPPPPPRRPSDHKEHTFFSIRPLFRSFSGTHDNGLFAVGQGLWTCDLVPMLRGAPHLVECSAVAILKILNSL